MRQSHRPLNGKRKTFGIDYALEPMVLILFPGYMLFLVQETPLCNISMCAVVLGSNKEARTQLQDHV